MKGRGVAGNPQIYILHNILLFVLKACHVKIDLFWRRASCFDVPDLLRALHNKEEISRVTVNKQARVRASKQAPKQFSSSWIQ